MLRHLGNDFLYFKVTGMIYLSFFVLIYSAQIILPQNNLLDQDSSFVKRVDKINPIIHEFPGGRGADEIVVYTPEYGNRTGTNSYGIEVTVVENMIQNWNRGPS